MAQYPTGNLLPMTGPPNTFNWPPKLPQVSFSQSSDVPRNLWWQDARVWPWAELWALNADVDQWNYIA